MIIAVDFDGTIVEHRYPAIGKELPFAMETIKALQKRQHQIILWTFRAGKELEEAVEYCKKRGVEFYAVNKNYPEEQYDETISRKINAIYILMTEILVDYLAGVRFTTRSARRRVSGGNNTPHPHIFTHPHIFGPPSNSPYISSGTS
jgi:hypothetical protein